MPSLADLHRAVQTTLASKRLGTPVFVAYHLHVTEKGLTERLAQTLSVARDWIGQSIDRVYAVGSAKQGHISLTVEFRGGATALLSCTTAPGRGDGVDLTVVGNHGAIYHDAGNGKLWDEASVPLAEKPDQSLIALIQKALQSGQPVSVGERGEP